MSSSATAYFTVISGLDGLFEIPLTQSTATAGNSDAVDIKLPSQYVSRRHFSLRFDVDTYYISDLGSTNGTQVNGVRLQPSVEHILRDGAQVHLAGERVQLVFHEVICTENLTIPVDASTPPPRPSATPSELLVDSSTRSVFVRGVELAVLPRKEFDILECLFQNKGTAVSRDTIAAAGWPERSDEIPNQDIDQYIRRLRLKVEENASEPKIIITRTGFGYMIP